MQGQRTGGHLLPVLLLGLALGVSMVMAAEQTTVPEECEYPKFTFQIPSSWGTYFYYDKEKDKCLRYFYIVFEKKRGLFESEETCERKCSDKCNHKPVDENCHNRKEVFFYTGKCSKYSIRSCGDKGFKSMEECQNQCGNRQEPKETSQMGKTGSASRAREITSSFWKSRV